MKKTIITAIAVAVAGIAQAQEKGRFEVHNFDNFKLHVYYTNDVMGDASYIVEGRDGVVTMEQPLFKDNVAEFDAYLNKLGKKVVNRVADYHVGGTADSPYTMPEGMPAFVKGPIYGGMMQGFAKQFGQSIVDMPTGKTSEVSFGSTQTWAGVGFTFNHGASTDFPAASIIIGGKVCYTHWAPTNTHANALNISSGAALDAEIEQAEKNLATGAQLFIGGHGGAVKADEAKAHLEYLKTMKKLMQNNKEPQAWVPAMKKAYPGMTGEEGLEAVAQGLYK